MFVLDTYLMVSPSFNFVCVLIDESMDESKTEPYFCLCENKGVDQLCSAFVFPTRIIQ